MISLATYPDYGIKLQHPLKRLVSFGLIKGTNTEIYVPMELCTVVFGQPYRSDLPIKAKADMIKFAAQPPDSSKRLILSKGLRALGHDAAGNTALVL